MQILTFKKFFETLVQGGDIDAQGDTTDPVCESLAVSGAITEQRRLRFHDTELDDVGPSQTLLKA